MSEVKRLFVDRSKCLGCKTCELRCAVMRGSVSKNLLAAVREDILPRNRVYVHADGGENVAVHCRQCENAPCAAVCSTGALKTDPDTGVKYIDADKCINCWMCVMACPYGMISPATERHSADKCDQCFQMEQPYCMAACPTGAIELLTASEIEEKLRQKRENTIND
ncbi:MAG: 4Fe-4S dicluster domain-containing protein [Candidatus Heteroscillospira sp.]|jgi:carbon-monoxide dehydrogenase iron sulfur subunit